MCIYIYTYIGISLSLYIYIYIYIHIHIPRAKEILKCLNTAYPFPKDDRDKALRCLTIRYYTIIYYNII